MHYSSAAKNYDALTRLKVKNALRLLPDGRDNEILQNAFGL